MEELERAARKRQRTKAAAAQALDELRQEVIKAVTEQGVSEADAARRGGIDRMTVRKWLGKL
jgi:transposase